MQKKFFQTIVKISLVSLVLATLMFQFSAPAAEAGSFIGMLDSMTRLKISEQSAHTFNFTLPAGINWDSAGNTDDIIINFPAAFSMITGWATFGFFLGDTEGGVGTTVTTYAVLETAGSLVYPSCVGAGANDAVVAVDTTNLDFGFRRCTGSSDLGSGIAWLIYTWSGAMVNPAAPGSAVIQLSMTDEGVASAHGGSLAVGITSDDQVIITATVDPTFSFALSSNTCALGSLTTANVKTCTYVSTVSTNATSGYVATILAESDGTNINLNNDANAAIFINDVVGGVANTGTEEYGFSIGQFGFGLPPSFNSDDAGCNQDASEPAQPLSASPVTYAGSSGPVTGNAETLCHVAAISVTSEAGTYQQIVTLIATGRF